ncbi:unnamed protein product [uncultured virus]|nr:unnamed protein product [uncultured virus]
MIDRYITDTKTDAVIVLPAAIDRARTKLGMPGSYDRAQIEALG